MTKAQFEDLFRMLTTSIVPRGYEHFVMDKFAKKYNLRKDDCGNYYVSIGDSRTIFTSHTDTVGGSKPKMIKHMSFTDEVTREKCICTDGKTILGADDKAGVAIMFNMIENNIPGLYLFFVGEECGAVGSRWFYNHSQLFDETKFDRVISFDRRGYSSVITKQFGTTCCSEEFANALSTELNATNDTFEYKPDPTGIFTDSAVFMNDIPECTNLSVGYFYEHTVNECINIDFLYDLSESVCKINWESLPVVRDLTVNEVNNDELEFLALEIDELLFAMYGLTCPELARSNSFKVGKKLNFIYKGSSSKKGNQTALKMVIYSDSKIKMSKGRKSMSFLNIDDVFNAIVEKKLNKLIE